MYHFRLLRDHLRSLGHDYGDFPAHGGLWENALQTAHDPLARMAVIPRYFEARGLDVTPGIQDKLRKFGDLYGCSVLDIILRDEIGHVAAGLSLPRKPFNRDAREQTGFSQHELDAL
jgi:uncharacterized ferritin-like protein (DUF455 family)